MFILFNNDTFHEKNLIDPIRLVYRTEYLNSFFSGEGGRLFEGSLITNFEPEGR